MDISTPKRLVLLDTTNLVYRAWHSFEQVGLIGPQGQPFSTVYGFFRILQTILPKFKADGVVAAFDTKTNFRKESYPDYKAGRTKLDADFFAQLEEIREILELIGVTCLSVEGWEADDIIASMVELSKGQNINSIMVSADRDLLALVSEKNVLYKLGQVLKQSSYYKVGKVIENYGIKPSQYLDFAALRGDKSDNLSGVDGIGPKKAAQLLSTYGGVNNIYNADKDEVSKIIGKKGVESLYNQKDRYKRNVEIMEMNKALIIQMPKWEKSMSFYDIQKVMKERGLPKLQNGIASQLGIL